MIAGTENVAGFGDFYVDQIRPMHVETWRAGIGGLIQKGEYAPTTANGWLYILRHILKRAKRELQHPFNAAEDVPAFDTSEHEVYTEEEPNTLTAEESAAFLACMKEEFPAQYAMTFLGFATGLRPSSMRPLRRSGTTPDVLWDQDVVLVRRSHTLRDELRTDPDEPPGECSQVFGERDQDYRSREGDGRRGRGFREGRRYGDRPRRGPTVSSERLPSRSIGTKDAFAGRVQESELNRSSSKVLRLVMPQWQGGNQENYALGAELLAWLAPKHDQREARVEVEPYHEDERLQDGVKHREALLRQLREAKGLIEEAEPEKIVVFGGDCLVEQAPVSYLNERYDGELGVLWIDAHPDVKTPAEFSHAHAMVVGNLLGEGDPQFACEVRKPLAPEHVMFAGLREDGLTEQEKEVIGRLGLRAAGPTAVAETSTPVLEWVEQAGVEHIAIHLDLDVLDPDAFRSVLFAEPEPHVDWCKMSPSGKMTLPQVSRLMGDVAQRTNVVGLGICEHLPWDMMNLKKALATFPLLR